MSSDDPASSTDDVSQKRPRALIMWKNTDADGEFFCTCGAETNWGGCYCNYIKCSKCGAVYEMPRNLFPRRVTTTKYGIEPIVTSDGS